MNTTINNDELDWQHGFIPHWTPSLAYHVVIMTLIGIICLPLAFSFIIKNQETKYNITQFVNTFFVVLFGVYAEVTNNKPTQTFHSLVGALIAITMLISSLLTLRNNYIYKKYKTYKSVYYISLLSFVYPLQFFVGICEFMGNQYFLDDAWDLAHILIGLGFFITSVVGFIVLINDEKQFVGLLCTIETIALFLFFFVPTFVTLGFFTGTDEAYLHQIKHHLAHYLIYFGCGVGSMLCLLIRLCLKTIDEAQWELLHSLTVAFVLILMGMLLYGHEVDERVQGAKGYHSMIGIVMVLCAVLRALRKYEAFGILWATNGWLLCFSNPVIGYIWVHVWNLSIKSFYVITLMLCWIIMWIFIILISLLKHKKKTQDEEMMAESSKISQRESQNESETVSLLQNTHDVTNGASREA